MKRIYLETARRRARLTQAELGRRIGKPQSFISKIERGEKSSVTVDEAKALGRELGVDPLAIVFAPAPQRESVA